MLSVCPAVVLKDHGMVPFIKIFLDDEWYRGASLSILEQLSVINAEEYMSIIVGALCSSTHGELQLKLDLLKVCQVLFVIGFPMDVQQLIAMGPRNHSFSWSLYYTSGVVPAATTSKSHVLSHLTHAFSYVQFNQRLERYVIQTQLSRRHLIQPVDKDMEHMENCTRHPCSGLQLAYVSFYPFCFGQNFDQESSWMQEMPGNVIPGSAATSQQPVNYGSAAGISGAPAAASFTWQAFREHLAITRSDAERLGHTTEWDIALAIWGLSSMLEEAHRERLTWVKEAKGSQGMRTMAVREK